MAGWSAPDKWCLADMAMDPIQFLGHSLWRGNDVDIPLMRSELFGNASVEVTEGGTANCRTAREIKGPIVL